MILCVLSLKNINFKFSLLKTPKTYLYIIKGKTIYSLFNCQYYVFKSQGQVTRLHVEVELVGDILVLIDGTQVGSLQSSILTSRE